MSVQSSMVMIMNTVRKAWYMSSKRALGSCGLPTCVCEWGRGVIVFMCVCRYFCPSVCECCVCECARARACVRVGGSRVG